MLFKKLSTPMLLTSKCYLYVLDYETTHLRPRDDYGILHFVGFKIFSIQVCRSSKESDEFLAC